MYLEELIEGVQLENDKLECKAQLNRDDIFVPVPGGTEHDEKVLSFCYLKKVQGAIILP